MPVHSCAGVTSLERWDSCVMKFSKFNHEGYYDPTSVPVRLRTSKRMKSARRDSGRSCTSAHPYAGGIKETQHQSNAQTVLPLRRGQRRSSACSAPATFPQFMDDEDEQDHEHGHVHEHCILMSKCAEVWVFGEQHLQRHGCGNPESRTRTQQPDPILLRQTARRFH